MKKLMLLMVVLLILALSIPNASQAQILTPDIGFDPASGCSSGKPCCC